MAASEVKMNSLGKEKHVNSCGCQRGGETSRGYIDMLAALMCYLYDVGEWVQGQKV